MSSLKLPAHLAALNYLIGSGGELRGIRLAKLASRLGHNIGGKIMSTALSSRELWTAYQ